MKDRPAHSHSDEPEPPGRSWNSLPHSDPDHAPWSLLDQRPSPRSRYVEETAIDIDLDSILQGRLAAAKARVARLLNGWRKARRRLAAERALNGVFAAAASLAEAAPLIARIVCERLDWDVGVIWLLDRPAARLRCVDLWHRPGVEIPCFERDVRRRLFPRGVGLPGRVWETVEVVWTPDLSVADEYLRSSLATADGLRTAIGVPVHDEGGFSCVLEFLSRRSLPPDADLAVMLRDVAGNLCQFLKRRDAELRCCRQEHERRLGGEIQQGLLPRSRPSLAGFEIGGRSTAPHVVGGDCFDFIPMPVQGRDGLGVLVADASGHGLSAAMMMTQARAYLRGL
ncbi:MAG TPA: GAF domain-containing protein, partial [Planctomycetia bacterium]|nr:GAF domain-containing protein [Planctomycetia bacterium]